MDKISSKTLFNLTFREIVSIISAVAAFLIIYMSLNIRISSIELEITKNQTDIIRLEQVIRENRDERIDQIQKLREENSDEHSKLLEGQNRIIDYLMK